MIFERTPAGINDCDRQNITMAIIEAVIEASIKRESYETTKEGGAEKTKIQLMHYKGCQKYNQEVIHDVLSKMDMRLLSSAVDMPVTISGREKTTIII